MEGATEEVQAEAADLMTDREAAAYLRLSAKFGHVMVQRLARTGLIRAGKVGAHWRFRKEDLDDYVFSKK